MFVCFLPIDYMKLCERKASISIFQVKVNIGLYLISVLIKCSPFVVGLGRRKWQPLQCSCLRNPVDRRAWWAAVHGVTQSCTRLKRLSMRGGVGEGTGSPLQSLAWRIPGTEEPGGLPSMARTESDTTEVT